MMITTPQSQYTYTTNKKALLSSLWFCEFIEWTGCTFSVLCLFLAPFSPAHWVAAFILCFSLMVGAISAIYSLRELSEKVKNCNLDGIKTWNLKDIMELRPFLIGIAMASSIVCALLYLESVSIVSLHPFSWVVICFSVITFGVLNSISNYYRKAIDMSYINHTIMNNTDCKPSVEMSSEAKSTLSLSVSKDSHPIGTDINNHQVVTNTVKSLV